MIICTVFTVSWVRKSSDLALGCFKEGGVPEICIGELYMPSGVFLALIGIGDLFQDQ